MARCSIKESRRWAEPLRNEISRVVAGELGRLLDSCAGAGPEWRLRNSPPTIACAWTCSASMRRWARGWPSMSSGDWSRRRAKPLTGRSRLHEAAEGVGEAAYEQLLAAERRALQRVARDIAAEIRRSASFALIARGRSAECYGRPEKTAKINFWSQAILPGGCGR
jgi:hypothetical protein